MSYTERRGLRVSLIQTVYSLCAREERPMRLCVVVAILLVLFPAMSMSADIAAHGLDLSYSRDKQICREAAELLADDKACRPDDLGCPNEEGHFVVLRGARLKVFEEIATNEYGYTEVYRATGSSLNGFAVVYVQRFQGDRFPRLVETWKMDAAALEEVLKLPPGPVLSVSAIKVPQETNATEFATILHRGQKLTDEWSPVIEIHGEPYLVERECSGRWVYGGIYACNKVIKLTAKRLSKDRKAAPYCQFTKARKK